MAITTLEEIPAGYIVLKAVPIPRMHGHLYDLVHEASGARHVHLAVPDRNNYFCAMYRTPPNDSTGAPHIMEHCVSGGSRRWPPGAGGDMYTRSLITDINGMTHSDFTTFYVATRNQTDYLNWMDYIVDVTQYPRMEEDTFLKQRGHFEIDESGRLRFTGTVFNEMKATFGSPARHAYSALNRALFPGHPYAESSGGDPAVMPELTYEQIMAFFERFYHPGNASFISRGDIPLQVILEKTAEIVGEDKAGKPATVIPDIEPLPRPVVTKAPMPATDEDARGQVALGWVTRLSGGDSYERLCFDVATEVLFEDQEGPVRRALRASGLATGTVSAVRAPYVRAWAALLLTDVDPANAHRIEEVVMDALAGVVRDGFDEQALEDAIARIELRQRDQSNGLSVFLDTVFPPLLYGGDVFTALELDADVERLRSTKPLQALVRTHFVDNPHRALVTLHPDPSLETRVREVEESWVAEVDAGLTDADREEVIATTKRLLNPPTHPFDKRGLQPEDGLTVLEEAQGSPENIGRIPVDVFDQPTDGITYLTVRLDLSGIDDELVDYIGVFGAAMTRQARSSAARATGISAQTHTRIDVDGNKTLHWLELTARALERDSADLVGLVRSALGSSSVDAELAGQLASESAAALEQRVMPQAQVLLRRLSASGLRSSGALDDRVRGLTQLAFLKRLLKEGDLGRIAGRIGDLRAQLVQDGRVAVCAVGAETNVREVLGPLGELLADVPSGEAPSAAAEQIFTGASHRARIASLPVAFTSEAFAIGGLSDPDGPAAGVLGQLAFSGYLNSEIRKGGAYGVDFEILPERGLFWISSRRDPMPVATYRAFDEAWSRFRDGRWEGSGADEGKLAILRMTDPVDTPATAARRAWTGRFTGHTTEAWNTFRARVLDVTDDDLQRVARSRFNDPSRATLIGRSQLEDEHIAPAFDEVEDV